METVYVESSNFKTIELKQLTAKSNQSILNFLTNATKELEEDDSFYIYSQEMDDYNRYRLEFEYKESDDDKELYHFYSIDLIKMDGEIEHLRSIYYGTDIEKVKAFIWENRKLFNQGIWGGC